MKQIILWNKPKNFQENLFFENMIKKNDKTPKEGTIEGVEIVLFNAKYHSFKYIKNNIKKKKHKIKYSYFKY